MNDASHLLRRFADTGDQAAFRKLVETHLGLVYHAALRQLEGDAHHARDASQVVFTELARKATSLARRPFVLAGWLHTATRHATARIRRAEHRRRIRETAAFMNPVESSPTASADWTRLRPVIDDALHALADRDRDAVLLRFFEGRAYAEIGRQFAITEDGARRRVERALEKLRDKLIRRGVVSTTSALGLALGTQSGLAAPAGLAVGIVTTALANLSTTGAGASAFAAAVPSKFTLAAGGVLLAAFSISLVYSLYRPSVPRPASAPASTTPASSPVAILAATDLLGADYLARLRGVSAADFGRLLVELWHLGTPEARKRFREIFDLWCQLDPESASRWAVITRTGIGDEGGKGGDGGHALRRQAVLAWAARDVDAAYTWVLTQPGEEQASFYNLTHAILTDLAETDPARALDLARRLTPDPDKLAFQSILQTWAKTDPVAALQALKKEPALDHPGGDLDARMVGIWSKHDLDAATRWVLAEKTTPETRNRLISGLAPAPEHTRATLDTIVAWWADRRATVPPAEQPHLSGILRRWAETNTEDAVEFADSLPDDLRTPTLIWAGISARDYNGTGPEKTLAYDPVASLAFIALLPGDLDPKYGTSREKLTNDLLRLWAEIEPDRVATWSKQQLTTGAALPEQAAALGALVRQDLAAALTTLEKLPSDGNREALSIALAQAWSEKDPAAAFKWVGAKNLTPKQAGDLTPIISRWMIRDPDAATAWIETDGREAMKIAASFASQSVEFPEGMAYTVRLTPDPELRRTLLAGRAERWLAKDRSSAMRFLRETPLISSDEKAYLLGLAPKE